MNDLQAVAVGIGSAPATRIAAFAAITVAFAAFGRLVRGVTTSGSVAGGCVCFVLMCAAGWGGLACLGTVFLLTWGATRLGYQRKLRLHAAESRAGRNAGQVLANLGAASIAAAWQVVTGDHMALLAMSAALAEAAADTASSEVGKAFGGAPRLVTTWRTVPAGTDGAITMLGTFAALGSALVVGLVGVVSGVLPVRELGVCLVAGFAGTVADSLLGATMERKGLLENNGVNLISTAVAAVLAWVVGSHFVHVA